MGEKGIIFIGGETSGMLRRRFQAQGYEVYSCDLLPSEDGGEETVYGSNGLTLGRHMVGDMFDCLDNMLATDLCPLAAIFHPTCTFLTISAEWAYQDANYERYPGVGYHQRVKAETLVGAERRAAREIALTDIRRIIALPVDIKVWENPIGVVGSRIMAPSDVVQPYEFGDDASKATCLTFVDRSGQRLPVKLSRDPQKRVPGRMVNGVERWANQTDSGQNKLPPGADRWKDRSRTYPGVADALVATVLRQIEEPAYA